MEESNTPKKEKLSPKIGIVVFLIFTVLFAITVKLFTISLIEGSELRKKAEDLVIENITIKAERGNIYSADRKLLATTMPVYNLFMDPTSPHESYFSKTDTEDNELHRKQFDTLCFKLSGVFPNRSASEWRKFIQSKRINGDRYIRLGKNVSYATLSEIKKFPVFNLGKYGGGLIIEQVNYRKKPLGAVAERTIGYDQKHHAGIEAAYNTYLTGENGYRLKQRLAKGYFKPIANGKEKEPKHGLDVITTIDTKIQDIAHTALLNTLEKHRADHGCVVVMEVATGDIKAISNLGRTEQGTYYEKRNYAVYEATEPGSTFKTLSLMVALDDKVVDTADIVDTEYGVFEVYNRKVKDSNVKNGKGGYGKITVAEAFRKSSNVGIVKAIFPYYKDEPEKFTDQLYNMGIHKKLNLSITGEGTPSIPTPQDRNWSGTSLPWMTFGYEVSLTPLQVLAYYNAIANNGTMVKPRFVTKIEESGKAVEHIEPIVLNPAISSSKTIEQIQSLLEGVVRKGTARNIYNPHLKMAGKTGTSRLNYWTESLEYQASFAGYFPADNPQYSCIVVVNKPDVSTGYYGNIVAAPVFRAIADEVFLQTPVAPVETTNQLLSEKENTLSKVEGNTMPNLKGLSGGKALAYLENLNKKVKVSGNGKVTSQWPQPGTDLSNIGIVTLYLR